MKIDRVLELLKSERECVTRQSPCNDKSKLCNRNCGECDIAQNDLELIEMYDFVISMMEIKQDAERLIIVRCMDCKHGCDWDDGTWKCIKNGGMHAPDWFCADGERMDRI